MIIHLSWAKKASYTTQIWFGAVPNFSVPYFFSKKHEYSSCNYKRNKLMCICIGYIFRNQQSKLPLL